MPQNNKNTQSNEWKNSWKNGWKDPAYQNVSDDVYVYQRDSGKSKWQQFKDVQQNNKSEYVGVRRQARKDIVKIVLPTIGTLLLVGIALFLIFF